ncbi:MAG: 16S rRNA (cytidine(1402)-2'-O)-methyltransferase [Tepidimonas sp.]|uniref:16S rRNA (cytidine(1402)-2'-O)-methyltransferase n=1 Tax=Tepidimonas sp. TaxID=2002775 RepID=UPI00259E5818|nr:16S rRNA (cytidine(1402)-2'-O)-methyltransferase [Tepidimonas sp.]MDM7455777.1 16S rRNA (cytidine(1402)-2'-O)-methyltransferase [Tepidimonas sp.]
MAARLAGSQDYPAGALYIVATPIGNLADITLRALHVLRTVDAVACEDTRHTARLLQAYGLHAELLAVHEHNESRMAPSIVERLRRGERIACVSDAGTPGISDPGARLCAAVRAAGLRLIPVPGASSLTALLSVAGIAEGAVTVVGFLPARGAARERAWRHWCQADTGLVLLEAPHRIEALAAELSALGERPVTLGRELTKQFEDIVTLPCAGVIDWLAADPHRRRGEFTLVIHPRSTVPPPGQPGDEDAASTALPAEAQRVLSLLLDELPVKSAARLASAITGVPKGVLYQAALALRAPSHD